MFIYTVIVQYQHPLHLFFKKDNTVTVQLLNYHQYVEYLSITLNLPIESPQRPRPQLHSHPSTGWPACRAPSPWRPRYHGAAHPPATPERMERGLQLMERRKLKIMLGKLPQSSSKRQFYESFSGNTQVFHGFGTS